MLIVLGVLVSGAVVWAITNVSDVVEKKDSSQICSSSDPNDQECHKVSFDDFNYLIDVTRGIFNTVTRNNHKIKIGINIESEGKHSSLIVKDLILVKPGATKPECQSNFEGAIFADSGDGHLWGCNGTEWKQLDTDPPTCP